MAIYKLGDIGEFKGGISNLQKNRYDKGINFINYMDILNNFSIDKNVVLRKYDATNKDIFKYGVKYGDIFFTASSETINEIAFSSVYLSNKNAIFNGFSKRFRFKHSILNPKYAGYFFRSSTFRNIVKKHATGYTRYNISQNSLNKIKINIPNLKAQKEIIKIIEPYENLFLSYSQCVRIDNIKNTKKDIKNLIDIIEPLENLEKNIKNFKKIVNNSIQFCLKSILGNKKTKLSKILKISSNFSENLTSYGVGKNGLFKNSSKVKRLKKVDYYDICIGYVRKNRIDIGINGTIKNMGVSSAYKVIKTSKEPILSHLVYEIIKKDYLKWTLHSSRGTGTINIKKLFNEFIYVDIKKIKNMSSHFKKLILNNEKLINFESKIKNLKIQIIDNIIN